MLQHPSPSQYSAALLYIHVFLVLRNPKLYAMSRCNLISTHERWMTIFPVWLPAPCWGQPRSQSAARSSADTSSFAAHWNPTAFAAELLPSSLVPATIARLLPAKDMAPISSFLRTDELLWITALHFSISVTPLNLVPCSNLLRVQSLTSVKLLIKVMNLYRSWYSCLRNWLPVVFCSTDDNTLGPAAQPIFHSLYCPLIQSVSNNSEHKDTIGDHAKGSSKSKYHPFTVSPFFT